MSEIKKLNEQQESKPFQRLGAKEISETTEPQILGAPVTKQGDVQIHDRNSPVEPTRVELHTHADRKSFKDATEKDQ